MNMHTQIGEKEAAVWPEEHLHLYEHWLLGLVLNLYEDLYDRGPGELHHLGLPAQCSVCTVP